MKTRYNFRLFSALAIIIASVIAVLAIGCTGQSTAQTSAETIVEESSSEASSAAAQPKNSRYSLRDIKKLQHTENFSKNALEHIFAGTINKKGKATGYHYSLVADSPGRIIEGTRSRRDENGVFTAKVEVSGVKKNGFSSFYPEAWSPQEVVEAINRAYKDALDDPENPRGNLWIGYDGDIEIDMYLDDKKKIVTAYPIFEGE